MDKFYLGQGSEIVVQATHGDNSLIKGREITIYEKSVVKFVGMSIVICKADDESQIIFIGPQNLTSIKGR